MASENRHHSATWTSGPAVPAVPAVPAKDLPTESAPTLIEVPPTSSSNQSGPAKISSTQASSQAVRPKWPPGVLRNGEFWCDCKPRSLADIKTTTKEGSNLGRKCMSSFPLSLILVQI
jgi:hypothetical protein